jgi:hypothetical protein
MTNKEKAQALWDIVSDGGRGRGERQAAAAELLDLKAKAKTTLVKLGLPDYAQEQCLGLMGPEPTTTHQLGGGTTIETNIPGFNPTAALDEFEATEEELSAQKLRPTHDEATEEPHGHEVLITDDFVLPDDGEVADEAVAEAKAEERGLITALVKRLLQETELGYAEIVAKVRTAFPTAATTTRSVASTASEMRAKGLAVPTRRRAAKGA